MNAVVVVESPAKAKTINKYLGGDYTVLASYGHVRDLPSKDGSVLPDEDFRMIYQTDSKSDKQLKDIAAAVKGADMLYLATDPDREGEAISWHVLEEMKRRRVMKGVGVKRIVFNEITKTAVKYAIDNPRDLDDDLINAQQARRALDYLVGFNLSPVLWRKLPQAKSAGRVQSVALRLVCERENEIERFKPVEYWSIEGDFVTAAGKPFTARLTHSNGKKLDKHSLTCEADAKAVLDAINIAGYAVAKVDAKQTKRNPQPPFTTSTLQQEAARKLHFNAKQTMQVAQKLYEGFNIGGETVGLITYMRTDGVQMANEAIHGARDLIGEDFGPDYTPAEARHYSSKAKNAQEAHEAVRPTSFHRRPKDIKEHLNDEQFKLYDLIWKRAIASQMAQARLDQVAVDIVTDNDAATFRANGSVVAFDGFLKVYEEGRDDSKDDGKDKRLPAMAKGEQVDAKKIKPEQHFTEPPPRYSEASLVKKLEELGIGRPSTYAAILAVLSERGYVRTERNRFFPEDSGRLVTAFLENFFERYVQYDFTASLENELDAVSAGEEDWKAVLRRFWDAFHAQIEEAFQLRTSEVIDRLDEALNSLLFPVKDDGDVEVARKCPSCEDGRLGMRIGKTGAFIGCSNYPECRYTRAFSFNPDAAENGASGEDEGPRLILVDPDTGMDITLRKGPYGWYLQLGEAEKGSKPKRASIPKDITLDMVDEELALKLISLPRLVGEHPETGKEIKTNIGRYGPYLQYDGGFAKLQSTEDVLTIGLNRAVDVIASNPKKGRGGAKTVLKDLGKHPDDDAPINVYDGRYGPYVNHGKINATLPKGTEPESVTVEQALEWLAEKAAKSGKKAPAKKKPAAKKTAAKKPAAKKPAAKKAPAKKKADTKEADTE